MTTKRTRPDIVVKRVYEPTSRTDGARFLVERLWPRGIKKTELKLTAWLREVAPTTALRKWFSHDPARWEEFQRRYALELDARPDAWQPLVAASRSGRATLLYSSHDTEHNNAVALRDYLLPRGRSGAGTAR